MPAPVIAFETAVVARRVDAVVVVALLDGALEGGEAACVAIITCPEPTARALVATLCSVLGLLMPQGLGG